jgi:hypothetical protein
VIALRATVSAPRATVIALRATVSALRAARSARRAAQTGGCARSHDHISGPTHLHNAAHGTRNAPNATFTGIF